MKLQFVGADHQVTGSCHYLEACGKRFLVDYGMEQGNMAYESKGLPCSEAEIDFVLLTHAHVDHSGNLPLLYKNGFDAGKYISFEEQINKYKDLYYNALQQSPAGWDNNQNDYFPFVQNFICYMTKMAKD